VWWVAGARNATALDFYLRLEPTITSPVVAHALVLAP
jgi:hypothetical protein